MIVKIAQWAIFACCLPAAIADDSTEPTLEREIVLAADLSTGKSATVQIQEAFGKGAVESPDLYDENHPGFEHIQLSADREVGSCFVFYLHRDKDGDRDVTWPPSKARQRNEIKGYKGSSEVLKAGHGQVVRYRWLFRIDELVSVTKHFCHFFQLKAVGGKNVSSPLFTISGGIENGIKQLEFRSQETEQGPWERTKIFDWKSCKGKWLECECLVRFHEEGYFRLSLRSLDDKLKFARELDPIIAWREGSTFVRPKWGIYRSLEQKEAIEHEEETVSFANFNIQEWTDIPRHRPDADEED